MSAPAARMQARVSAMALTSWPIDGQPRVGGGTASCACWCAAAAGGGIAALDSAQCQGHGDREQADAQRLAEHPAEQVERGLHAEPEGEHIPTDQIAHQQVAEGLDRRDEGVEQDERPHERQTHPQHMSQRLDERDDAGLEIADEDLDELQDDGLTAPTGRKTAGFQTRQPPAASRPWSRKAALTALFPQFGSRERVGAEDQPGDRQPEQRSQHRVGDQRPKM